jgi:hypothetical protein
MRLSICLAVVASMLFASDSPFLKLNRTSSNGEIQFAAQNISGKPVVAYVVAVQHSSGQSSTVSYGVYTGEDRLAAGASVDVAKLDARALSGEVTAFVDYVRLADGTNWGDPVTEQGKEVAARFSR